MGLAKHCGLWQYGVVPMGHGQIAKGANMAKHGKGGAAAPGASTAAAPVLVVKGSMAYRGARQAWYQLLVAHAGKPASAFIAAATANPPSLPQKGKGAGKPEPASGWLRYFVRTGVASYAPQANQ